MLRFINRHRPKVTRVVFCFMGMVLALQGYQGYRQGVITYLNWYNQPVVPLFAFAMGMLFVVGCLIPSSVYCKLFPTRRK